MVPKGAANQRSSLFARLRTCCRISGEARPTLGQAEAIDNLCAKIAEVIHGDEPESDKVIGPT